MSYYKVHVHSAPIGSTARITVNGSDMFDYSFTSKEQLGESVRAWAKQISMSSAAAAGRYSAGWHGTVLHVFGQDKITLHVDAVSDTASVSVVRSSP